MLLAGSSFESTRISSGTVPSHMSLRNRVVDAGDDVKVDGEWRMPPKLDIVDDRQPGATGPRSPRPSLPEVTFQLQRRQGLQSPSDGFPAPSPRALLVRPVSGKLIASTRLSPSVRSLVARSLFQGQLFVTCTLIIHHPVPLHFFIKGNTWWALRSQHFGHVFLPMMPALFPDVEIKHAQS